MAYEAEPRGTATIRTFRDLLVWQKGMDLVEATYAVSARLPKHENFGLKMQMERLLFQSPANVAEGHARSSPASIFTILHSPPVQPQNFKPIWKSLFA